MSIIEIIKQRCINQMFIPKWLFFTTFNQLKYIQSKAVVAQQVYYPFSEGGISISEVNVQ